jgi:hypothetical protein
VFDGLKQSHKYLGLDWVEDFRSKLKIGVFLSAEENPVPSFINEKG